ncbi:endocytosis defective- protein [Coemansia sp. RSA 921]|nr:endocytosis defective- protein [Coemansia sp. RSA 921]
MNNLAISPEERQQYQQHFLNANPVNGKLPGAAARANLMQSGLSTQHLGEIWELADIDKDGALDFDEYSVAMKLVFSVLNRTISSVPPVLPPSLIPQSKYQHFGSAANLSPQFASPQHASQFASPQHATPQFASPNASVTSIHSPTGALDWYISGADRARYQGLFAQHSRGSENVRLLDMDDFLGTLGIARSVTTQAWNLVDVRKYQQLNQEQFIYLMHILHACTRGAPVPSVLAPSVKDAIYKSLDLGASDSGHGYRYNKPSRPADARTPGLYGERSTNVALADSYLSKLKTSSTFKGDSSSRYASSTKRGEEERKLRDELKELDRELEKLEREAGRDTERDGPGAREEEQLQTTLKELERLKEYKEQEKIRCSRAPTDEGTQSVQDIKQSIFQLEGHVSFLLSEKRAIDEFIDSGRQELLDLQMEQMKLK